MISLLQRKKRMEQLEHELLETRASEDKKKKIKMVSRTQLVFFSTDPEAYYYTTCTLNDCTKRNASRTERNAWGTERNILGTNALHFWERNALVHFGLIFNLTESF